MAQTPFGIPRRDITIRRIDGITPGLQPGEILFERGFRRHDPKSRMRNFKLRLGQQQLQVFQSRDPENAVPGHEIPQQHQKSAVGNGEIRFQQRLPIFMVAFQFQQGRSRRNHDETAARTDFDGGAGVADKKPDAENMPVLRFRKIRGD